MYILYAHDLSYHAHPYLKRAHRIFIYFVSQKIMHPHSAPLCWRRGQMALLILPAAAELELFLSRLLNERNCISSYRSAGKLFHTLALEAAKFLPPKVLRVRDTKHVLRQARFGGHNSEPGLSLTGLLSVKKPYNVGDYITAYLMFRWTFTL